MNKNTQVALLKKYRIPVRGQSGQHLLIDPNLQKKLTDFLQVEEGHHVLEIGPGLGALTAHLLQKKVNVVAIEKDERFVEILKDVFSDEVESKSLVLINEDVLKVNLKDVCEQYKIQNVISNLPYYITGPVLFHVFKQADCLKSAVFMMQTEVAERILSSGGNKIYGRLSVMSQFYAAVKHGCDVPPKCFAPPPDVHSTVLLFDFEKGLRHTYPLDPMRLEAFVKMAFAQRRKILLSLLKKNKSFQPETGSWDDVFKNLDLEPKLRPEQISPENFLRLLSAAGS